MAIAEELQVVIRAEVDKAIRDLESFGRKTDQTGSKMDQFAARAGEVGKTMSRYVTLPLIGAATAAVKFASDIERQQTAFGVLLQDVERGNQLFEELKTFSAETPLQLDDITRASQTLLAFGSNAENVQEQIRKIGDVAQGNAERVTRIAQAFGKVQARGRATMEELNVLMEAGVPIIAELAKNMEVTEAAVFDLVSSGKVGFADLELALTTMTGSGGQFEGMMEKIAQTTAGKFSTAVDNLKLAAAELGAELLPMVNEILDRVTETARWFSELDDGTKKLILTVGALAAAAGPLAMAVSWLIKMKAAIVAINTAAMFGPAGIIAAVAGLSAGLYLLAQRMTEVTRETRTFEEISEDLGTNQLTRSLEALNRELEANGENWWENYTAADRWKDATRELTNGLGHIDDVLKRSLTTEQEYAVMAAIRNRNEEELRDILEDIVALRGSINDETGTGGPAPDGGGDGLFDPPPAALTSWQEWFEDITGIAAETGSQAANDLLAQMASVIENERAVAELLNEKFDIDKALRRQETNVRSIIQELLNIPAGAIDEPFTLTDESIQILVRSLEELRRKYTPAYDSTIQMAVSFGILSGRIDAGTLSVEEFNEALEDLDQGLSALDAESIRVGIDPDAFTESWRAALEQANEVIPDKVTFGIDNADWISLGADIAGQIAQALKEGDSINQIIGDVIINTIRVALNMWLPGVGEIFKGAIDAWAWIVETFNSDIREAREADEQAERDRQARVDALNELLDAEMQIRNDALRQLDRTFQLEFRVLEDLWDRNIIGTEEFVDRMDEMSDAYETERDDIESEVRRIRELMEESAIDRIRRAMEERGKVPFWISGDDEASPATFSSGRGFVGSTSASGGGTTVVNINGPVYGIDDLGVKTHEALELAKHRGLIPA